MKVSGIGRVIFWGGGNLWIGIAVAPVDLHAHHSIQLAVGFDGPVEFRLDAGVPWSRYEHGALVRPGAPHEFRAPGRRIANILLEPESQLGRALLERFDGGPIMALDANVDDLAGAYDHGVDDEVLAQKALAFISGLAGSAPPRHPADPRILQAMDWIGRHLDQPMSLADVAAVANLSEGRLRHLFVEQTGIGFRPYVLWARLNRALEMGFGGYSWTEAAHAANFADSAHLTRTCRRMYGLTHTTIRIDTTAQLQQQIA